MSMTISDLISHLESLEETHGDLPVRIITDDRFPFECEVQDVALFEVDNTQPDEDDPDHEDDEECEDALYIISGRQLGYVSKTVMDEIGMD